VALIGDWALTPRELYPRDRSITLFQRNGSIPLFGDGDTGSSAPGNGTTIPGNLTSFTSVKDSPLSRRVAMSKRRSSFSAIPKGDFGAMPLLAKRAPSDDEDDPMDGSSDGPRGSSFTASPSCPARSGPGWRPPEMRVNCDRKDFRSFPLRVSRLNTNPRPLPDFRSWTVPGLGALPAQTVPGMCDGVQSLGNLQRRVLTYVGSGSSTDRRRDRVCPGGKDSKGNPRSPCTRPTAFLRVSGGYPDNGSGGFGGRQWELQCDEFPMGATEEGGTFMPANERTTTCIPAAQNNHAGQCVSESHRSYFPQNPVIYLPWPRTKNCWATFSRTGP
jgi:hypothetical protein